MSFQPVIVSSGYTGYLFLQRTLDAQLDTFSETGRVKQTTDYFKENIASVATAEDLVADRRLLEVALGAFGLQEDINNKFFIEKILAEGTESDEALASRLADKRYADFADAFGFGNLGGARTNRIGFADTIISQYEKRAFEIAVGEQDESLRLAINAKSEVAEIAASGTSNAAMWFQVMGNPPLRSVFETALGLPSSIAQLDLDRQLEDFRDAADRVFGTRDVADFSDPELQEDLVRQYLIRDQAQQFSGISAGSIALTLLQGA